MNDQDVLDRLSIPEPNSGCLLWTGYVDRYGYGQWPRARSGIRKAHRIAFEVARGRPPRGLICHKCDVPSCVNPDHLFEGSHSENVADMASKNRQSRGENQPNAKLTEAQVLEIKSSPASVDDAAAQFGVSRSLIGQIRQGLAWAHVKGAKPRVPASPKRQRSGNIARQNAR